MQTFSRGGEMVPMVIDVFICAAVRVSTFAGALFTPIDEILIPAVDDPAIRCQSTPPSTASARAKALGLLYPTVAAAHRQQAADACVTQSQRIRDEAMAKRRAAIRAAQDTLRAVSDLKPRGPCTALPQAVQRALQRSQHVIALT